MLIPLVFCISVLASPMFAIADDGEQQTLLSQALERAGDNRSELQLALQRIPPEQKAGLEFLISHMPDRDLQFLTADFLLENSRLATEAVAAAPWGKRIPEEILFDAVLPYANVSEKRDPWRADFVKRFSPLVRDAKTPSEAAAILNLNIFRDLNVRYSTKRRRADQSPAETMETGLASCTGLSILLIDACRAVGVPARLVGTPLWSDGSGNHTWVEIWDDGWHFTGACEATGKDLDRGWFTERAARAIRDDRLRAIYAVTFRRNGQSFPMVWAPDQDHVSAVNVTNRYTSRAPVPEGFAVLRVRVRNQAGERTAALITVTDQDGQVVLEEKTRDERFDSNDLLTVTAKRDTALTVKLSGTDIQRKVILDTDAITLDLQVP
ncbi:MAG: transglutaminase-like domain-containing protein [Planctomycetaceae bacterium]